MRFTYIGISLMVGTVWAADYVMDPKKRLDVPIAKDNMTRIFVEGDRIHQVFGLDGKYILETEEEMGQIFLKPLNDTSDTSFTLTLLTEEGVTQDLLLKPRAGIQESICLKPPQNFKKKARFLETSGEGGPVYVHHLLRSLKGALSPQSGELFEELPSYSLPETLLKDLQQTLTKNLQNDNYFIEIYELKNMSPTYQAVTLESLLRVGDIALGLSRKQLPPHGSALFIRVKLREAS